MFIPYRKHEYKREHAEERPSLHLPLPLPPNPDSRGRDDDAEKTTPRGVWTIDI